MKPIRSRSLLVDSMYRPADEVLTAPEQPGGLYPFVNRAMDAAEEFAVRHGVNKSTASKVRKIIQDPMGGLSLYDAFVAAPSNIGEYLAHKATGREGGPSAHWALIDYGSVVVHVMAPPEREYYQLEQLWSDAPLLLHVQ